MFDRADAVYEKRGFVTCAVQNIVALLLNCQIQLFNDKKNKTILVVSLNVSVLIKDYIFKVFMVEFWVKCFDWIILTVVTHQVLKSWKFNTVFLMFHGYFSIQFLIYFEDLKDAFNLRIFNICLFLTINNYYLTHWICQGKFAPLPVQVVYKKGSDFRSYEQQVHQRF